MCTAAIRSIVEVILGAPERTALINRDGEHSFGRLGACAQGVLDELAARPPGAAVIYGHKECHAVGAMLACALSGRPFVFADVTTPIDRLRRMVTLSGASMVIAARALPGAIEVPVVRSDTVAGRALEPGGPHHRPDALFYIVFTSGSTGEPKGVAITHGNFDHFTSWYGPLVRQRFGGAAHVNQASLSFDMGMLDLWPVLAAGRAVILLDNAHALVPSACLRFLSSLSGAAQPSSWWSTPTLFEIMCREPRFDSSRLPSLHTFLVGAEPVSRQLLRTLADRFKGVELWHGYGPSEVTCMTHCTLLAREDILGTGPVTLGQARLPNRVRIIDDCGARVPAGQSGEVELSGPQVSPGYLPAAVADNAAFAGTGLERTYRTGDHGAIDASESLTLYGRGDSQVKVNGNRIDLAEVEHQATAAPGVQRAVAVPIVRADRVVGLSLLVRPVTGERPTRESIMAHLARQLPSYMVPSVIRLVETLPVTAHGKLDRTKLVREASRTA